MLQNISHKIALFSVLLLAAPIACGSDHSKHTYTVPDYIEPENIQVHADYEQLKTAAPLALQRFVALLECDPIPTHLLPRGFILYGPPGTGKTEFAKALAIKSGFLFYNVELAQFGSPFVHSTVNNLQITFDKVRRDLERCNDKYSRNRKHRKGAIIFMDEIDAIVRSRSIGMNSAAMDSAETVSYLLTEIDGLMKQKYPIIIVGATNKPEMIDNAIKSRLHMVHVGLPNESNRLKALEALVEHYLKPGHTYHALQLAHLKLIAQRTEGMNYRDLVDIIKECATQAYLRQFSSDNIEAIIKQQREKGPASTTKAVDNNFQVPTYITPDKIDIQIDSDQVFTSSPYELQQFIALLKCNPIPTHLLPRGFIFYGPPGTGKTEIAKSLAVKSGFIFYNIEIAQFGSPHRQETIQNLKEIFDTVDHDLKHIATQQGNKQVGALIFIDEIESIAQTRGAGGSMDDARMVTYLLTAIEGLMRREHPIIIVGATNKPDMIDDAIKSRLHLIPVGLPNQENRLKALEMLNKKYFKHNWKLNHEKLSFISQYTQGMSYRDLGDIIRKCAVHSYITKTLSFDKIIEIIKEQSVTPDVSYETLYEAIWQRMNPMSRL